MSVILRAYNSERLIQGKPKTTLSAPFTSGTSTLTVEDIDGFAVSNWILIGQLGEEKSVVVKIHASTAPSGSTITLAATLSKDFPIGTPVTLFDYDQVEFSRATTLTGSKSVLATQSVTASDMQTIYEDATNTTGYGFYRFKNSASTTYSAYSAAIPYAGYNANDVQTIIDQALAMAASEENVRMRIDVLLRFVNDFIRELQSRDKRWADALVFNSRLANVSAGVWEINLPTDIARQNDPSAIVELRLLDYPALRYMDQRDFYRALRETRFAKLTTAITSVDTSMVFDNTYALPDAGTITIGSDSIVYTGNTRSTGTLTGVTGIDSNHAAGDYAFMRQLNGPSTMYTISDASKIRIWPIPGSAEENLTLFLTYFRSIPFVDSVGDNITVTDTKAAVQYVAYRIKKFIEGGRVSSQDEDLQMAYSDISRINLHDTAASIRRIRLH